MSLEERSLDLATGTDSSWELQSEEQRVLNRWSQPHTIVWV